MKRKTGSLVSILAICSFLATPLLAQNTLGLIGGFNVTNLIRDPGDVSSQHEDRVRAGFGLVADLPLSPRFSLHLEPMFIQKGAHFDFIDLESENLDARREQVDLTYLEVPALLKLRLLQKATAPYLLAGPSFAYLLSAKQGKPNQKRDIKDVRKDYDFGLTGGGGVFLTSDPVEIFLEVRYNYGLMNIDEEATDGSELRNNGFRILLGLLFSPRR